MKNGNCSKTEIEIDSRIGDSTSDKFSKALIEIKSKTTKTVLLKRAEKLTHSSSVIKCANI